MAQKGKTIILANGRKLKLKANEVGKSTIFRWVNGHVIPINLRKIRKAAALAAIGGGVIGAGILASKIEPRESATKKALKDALIFNAAFAVGTVGLTLAAAKFGTLRGAKNLARTRNITLTPLKKSGKLRRFFEGGSSEGAGAELLTIPFVLPF